MSAGNRALTTAAARGIESGDFVQVQSDRIPVQTDTTVGVEGADFDFDALLKNGRIELTRALITAAPIVTPAVKATMGCLDFLHTAPAGQRPDGPGHRLDQRRLQLQDGRGHGAAHGAEPL